MTASLVLAPFEINVLQAIHAYVIHEMQQFDTQDPLEHTFLSATVAWWGGDLHGAQWAGKSIESPDEFPMFPAINAAFGRLCRKGLVYRKSAPIAGMCEQNWGYWYLTPDGCELLGLPVS